MKKHLFVICISLSLSITLFAQETLSREEREWLQSEMRGRSSNQTQSFSPVPVENQNRASESRSIRTDLKLKPEPNLVFFGFQAGIGFSSFQSELHGSSLSYNAGLRFNMYFASARNIGFSVSAGFSQMGGNKGYRSYYYNDSVIIRYLNTQVTASFFIGGAFFGAGIYAAYKTGSDTSGITSAINKWDAGFVVEGGYIFDAGKNFSISVSVEFKAGAAALFSYDGSQMSNLSCNFNVGFLYGNLRAYQEINRNNREYRANLRLTERQKIREQITLEMENSQFTHINRKISVKGNNFTGPSFEFGDITFSIKDVEQVLAAAGLEDTMSVYSIKRNLSNSRKWIWAFFMAGPLCGIPSGINMGWAFDSAESLAGQMNTTLNESSGDANRLYLEFLVSHRIKKAEIDKSMASAYTFFGVYIAGGGQDINGKAFANDYYSYYKARETYTNFDIGLRYAKLYSLGKQTHWKMGFIFDMFYEHRMSSDYGYYYSQTNNGYIGGNLMLAFKNQAFYFGLGGNVNYRIKTEANQPLDYYSKKLEAALVLEPGMAFENKVKILFGMQIRVYLRKMKYTLGSSYYSQIVEKTGIPYTVMGQLSIGF